MQRKNPRATAHMVGRARSLRRQSSFPERLLWSRIRNEPGAVAAVFALRQAQGRERSRTAATSSTIERFRLPDTHGARLQEPSPAPSATLPRKRGRGCSRGTNSQCGTGARCRGFNPSPLRGVLPERPGSPRRLATAQRQRSRELQRSRVRVQPLSLEGRGCPEGAGEGAIQRKNPRARCSACSSFLQVPEGPLDCSPALQRILQN